MGHLVVPIMGPFVEKGLIGGYKMRLSGYLQLSGYLYEGGAIIGRARRDVLPVLARLFPVEPGKEAEAINFLQKAAHDRLFKFRDCSSGGDPKSFYLLVFQTELIKFGIDLSTTANLSQVTKALTQKIPLEQAEGWMKAWGLEGIGFGSSSPDLTEKMYRDSRNIKDTLDKIRQFDQKFAESIDPTKMVTLQEQEEIILSMVAVYAQDRFSSLLGSLRLAEYLAVD